MKNNYTYLNINKVINLYHVLCLFACLILFFILNSTTAYAAKQTIRVSPVIINLQLSPGKTLSQKVTIENLTSTPLPLRASLNDFVTGGEDGGYVFADTKTNPLLKWIKLSDDEFILSPKEKKKITMTIKMPSSIPVGGYYGILFFEPVVQSVVTNATQVHTKVGVLMLANLGVPDNGGKKADILTFTPQQLSQDGTIPFTLRVQNTSLNFFTAKPILTLTPILSTKKQTAPIYLEEKLIFPDKVRRWTDDQTMHDLSPNIYKVHLAVSTGNGNTVITDRYFVVFPLIKFLVRLGIFLIIIFLIIKRKRLGKVANALFP